MTMTTHYWKPRANPRRRAERFPVEAHVELVSPDGGRGHLCDASPDGLRVAIDRPLRSGDKYTAILRTERGHEYRDMVRVVWTLPTVSGCTAGLQFIER